MADPQPIYALQRILDDAYVDYLARRIHIAFSEEEDLAGALANVLRDEAPILLRAPLDEQDDDASSSFFGTLLKLALLGGATYGIHRAVLALTGQDLVSLAREQVQGNDDSEVPARTPATTRPTVPQPQTPPPASPTPEVSTPRPPEDEA